MEIQSEWLPPEGLCSQGLQEEGEGGGEDLLVLGGEAALGGGLLIFKEGLAVALLDVRLGVALVGVLRPGHTAGKTGR